MIAGMRAMLMLCALVIVPAVRAQTRADSGARRSGPTAPGVLKPKLPPTLKVPTTYAALFAERDVRAVAAIGYVSCMQGTIDALRAGLLGAVPREWSIACVARGTEWRGVFGELTDVAPGFAVRLQYATRARSIARDPLDTAVAGGVARALFRGLAASVPGGGAYEVVPIVLPQPTFIEVWYLPVPTSGRVVVGGDSLIQMSGDGARELGHAKNGAPLRTLSTPNSATWMIESGEERIPLLSELVAARRALDVAAQVTVRTRQYDATASRSAGAVVWTHTRR